MFHLPRKRVASAATALFLPALLLSAQSHAGADVMTKTSPVSARAVTAAASPHQSGARLSLARNRWVVVYNRAHSAQRGSVWRSSASFRASRKHPVVTMQLRQVAAGRVVTARTKTIRTRSHSWRQANVALRAARSGPSAFQVLVRRSGKARSTIRMSSLRVGHNAAVTVAPVSTPDPTPDPTPSPVTPPSLPGWGAPDWRDEFDGNAIDRTKWNVRTQSNLGLTMDSAIPDAGQVSVSGGLLHLRGDWLPATRTRSTSATGVNILTHKTGYIDQRRLHAGDVSRGQRYGRWEIRCKTPTGADTLGALAAFWLRNSNLGEIDMMEAWGYGSSFPDSGKALKDTAKTTFFTNTNTTASMIAQVRHREFGATGVPWAGFHTYAFELLPQRAAIVVDGKTIWTATPASLPALWGPSFQSPLHMRLNLHVGPSARYWGLPDPSRRQLTKPLDYQVDYVRTWAAPGL